MKKRMLTLSLALLLLATVLAGCTGGKDKNVDLAGFYSDLAETYEFGSHMAVEGDFKSNYYPGLEDVALTQEVLYAPAMSAVVSEIALVEVTDEKDVDTVKDIFQKRIDSQVDGGAWYPDTIQGWIDNAKIVSHGKYVMLVADENSGAIEEKFNALFE